MVEKRADLLAGLFLAAIVAFILWEAVVGGRVFFQRDIQTNWHPQVQSFVRAVTEGSWPTWDPYESFGQPLLADPNAEVLYPLTWLNLIFLPGRYYTLFVALHLFWSGLGLYCLAKRLGLRPAAAGLAAGLWICSGPQLSLLNLWHHLAGASWIPWVVLAADRAFSSWDRRQILALAGAFGMQMLAASADMCVMSGLLLLGEALWHAQWHDLFGRANRRLVGSAVLGIGLALALASCQWLPTFEASRHSARWSLPYQHRTDWSLHPLGTVQFLLPVSWNAVPLREDLRARMFQYGDPFLASLYLGLPSLGLVAAAFSAPRRHRGLLAGVGLLALLVALGRHSVFYDLAVAVIVPLRVFRYPVKLTVLVAFAWALLAGMGLEAWRERRHWTRVLAVLMAISLLAGSICWFVLFRAEAWGDRLLAPEARPFTEALRATANRFVLATLALLATLLLALLRRPRATSLVVALMALMDLLWVHARLNPTAPAELLAYRSPVLDDIAQADRRRVYVYDYYSVPEKTRRYLGRADTYAYALATVPRGLTYALAHAFAVETYLYPPMAGTRGVFGSFDRNLRGLYPGYLTDLNGFLRASEGRPQHLMLLRMGAVGRVVALHSEGLQDLTLVRTHASLFPEPIRVYRVPEPLPRAYAVGAARIADGYEAFRVLAETAFQPDSEVLIAQGDLGEEAHSFSGTVRIAEFRADRVVIEAEFSAPGYVVLVDTYDPGWSARLDGQPVRVLRANVAFRAVEAPAGRHTIEYRYWPRGLTAGLTLCGVALATMLVVGVSDERLRRRMDYHPPS